MGMSIRAKMAFAALTVAVFVGLSAGSASAADWGGAGGYDGNPTTCTSNINVGAAVPVKASDGRIVGYSQMRWSYGCQANWTKAWTVNGQPTTINSDIFQNRPPAPDRRFAVAEDYASSHFTMYIRAGATERMCGSTKMWDVPTGKWAFSGVYCRG